MTLVRLTLLFLAFSLLLAACGSPDARPPGSYVPTAEPTHTAAPTPDPSTTRGTSQDEDDIMETLLRSQFDNAFTDLTNPYKAYCLGSGATEKNITGLSDLPQTLLDRFKGNSPTVVKASDCAMVDDNNFGKKAVLKTTGERALFWAVSAVTWLGTARVELEVSHQGNFGDSGGQVFQLEKKNGKWQITGTTLTWTA